MSHTLTTLIECPTIQDKLNDYFLKGDPTFVSEPTPLLEFLTSPVNTTGVLQNQISAGNGKLRTIELVYESRFLENEVSTSAVQSCTSSNEAGQKSETYELDPTVGSEINLKFDLSDLALICEADENFINRQIMKMMDVVKRKMATTTWSQTSALFGAFGPSSGAVANLLTVRTLKSGSTTDIDTDFIEKISFAAKDTAYPTIPYLFGYDKIYKGFQKAKAGCCASSGLNIGDFAQQEGMAFFADYRAEAALGADEFLMTTPGAMQLLTYNEYVGPKGIRVIDTENYKQFVVRDPATGIPFDMMWKFDCGNIYVQLKVAHKLVGLPNDMFFGGDRMAGVTFVNNLKVSNA